MKNFRVLLLLCTLISVCLLPPLQVFAADNLQDFFAPARGTIIMPLADKFIIDLDVADNVAQGDLLSVIYEGEKIVHPTTGAILGTLNDYGPVLQITEIKSGYSYARLISGEQPIKRGDKISRFENIPVYFLDQSGQDAPLYSKLKRELPQLSWAGYLTETKSDFFHQRPLLLIKRLNDNLALLDQSNSVIQYFSLSMPAGSANPAAPPVAPAAPAPSAVLPLSAPQLSAKPLADSGLFSAPPPQRPAAEKQSGTIRSSRFNSQIHAIKFIAPTATGLLQAVIALDDKLILGTFSDHEFVPKSEVALNNHQQILKLASYDIDADGVSEILASGVNDLEIDSLILKVDNGQLVVHSRHNRLLNRHLSASGEVTLLGQSIDDLLAQPQGAAQLQLIEGEFKTGSFAAEPFFQLYGTTSIGTETGKQLKVMLTGQDNLRVIGAENNRLWQSEALYGGVEAAVRYQPQDGYQDNDPRKIYLKANIVTTARNSIITTRHEGNRVLTNTPNLGAGQIVELYWNGFSLEEAGSTPNLGGYIPDFDLADIDGDGDQDLVAAVVYTKKGLFTKPVSGIVVVTNDR